MPESYENKKPRLLSLGSIWKCVFLLTRVVPWDEIVAFNDFSSIVVYMISSRNFQCIFFISIYKETLIKFNYLCSNTFNDSNCLNMILSFLLLSYRQHRECSTTPLLKLIMDPNLTELWQSVSRIFSQCKQLRDIHQKKLQKKSLAK